MMKINSNASRRNLLLIFAMVALVSGCASYQAKPLVAEQTAAQLQARSLNDSALRDFMDQYRSQAVRDWPLTSWNIDDLTLAAFYFNPSIEQLYQQWQVARAGINSAAERPNPGIGLSAANNSSNDVPSPWILGATFDFPFATMGKRELRTTQASQLAVAAQLQLASAAWRVRSDVWAALVNYFNAQRSADLTAKQQELYSDKLTLQERQYQSGEISAFELTQARLEASNAIFAYQDALGRQTEAQSNLAELIGVPGSALAEVTFSSANLDLPEALPAAELRHQALLNRTDILAALAAYAATQSALQIEIANQYPDLNIGPGYEYDQGDNKWSLGLSVSLPVFNRNQAAITAAEIRRDQAAADFNAVQLNAMAEIDRAISNYERLKNRQRELAEMAKSMQAQELQAQQMRDAGESSAVEFTGLQLQSTALALTQLQAGTEAQLAAGQLQTALQLPLEIGSPFWVSAALNSQADGSGDSQ